MYFVSNEANRPTIVFYRIVRVYISCGCYSFVTNVLLIADIGMQALQELVTKARLIS